MNEQVHTNTVSHYGYQILKIVTMVDLICTLTLTLFLVTLPGRDIASGVCDVDSTTMPSICAYKEPIGYAIHFCYSLGNLTLLLSGILLLLLLKRGRR